MFDVVGRGLLVSQLSFCDIKVRGIKITKTIDNVYEMIERRSRHSKKLAGIPNLKRHFLLNKNGLAF